ncbi:MAG: hypothetical protein CL912_29055 [Deltaproteobacteria bacterium]|uniref:Uncharacterized protein n=1 Tax=Cadophora malorum TaxID=108018 RepID=A0A8H8BVA5_9HELO|nr:hypothetical protein IFR04_001466 [Cadophora malorum]MAD87026.1 hypothetical protein [Deltaproteobacteria bacterium]
MDSTETAQQQLQPNSITSTRFSQPPILQVNFSWRKFESLVSEKREGDQSPRPLYIVDYHTLKIKPKLIFKSATEEQTIFGTGVLHPISINCDCEIRGKPVKLAATSRIKTAYMHLSHNFSDTNEPVPMTWTSAANFKTWDFVCLDQYQEPVARFAANIWGVKKVGNIEFLGEKTATSEAAREEIVVMGMTLFSCMMLRMNNIFSLFGMIPSPAKVDDYKPVEGKDSLNGSEYTVNENGARVVGEKGYAEDFRSPHVKDAFNTADYTINDNGARVLMQKDKTEGRAEPVGY